METKNEKEWIRPRKRGVWIAILFIAVGAILLGNNLGYISDPVSNILISWQMLLIVIGLFSLFRRGGSIGGAVLVMVGTYFLMPKLGWMDYEPMGQYWPVLFILIGLIILLRPKKGRRHDWRREFEQIEENRSTDGFVVSDNTAGGVKQVVLDPVFKGARIRCTFGGTIIDLRRTKLENEITYIYVYCNFGGIELFMPSEWNVLNEADITFASLDDKRFGSVEKDLQHKVVIRGNITFGGVEMKN